jgi:hypothetical protein
MAWFKVDDGFYDHPKVADLPDSAVALWTRAASYCMKHLTDGAVPRRIARRFVDNFEESTAALVKSGLWEEDGTDYQFHDWADYQPTREELLKDRKKRSVGGAVGNHRRWHVEKGKVDPSCAYCRSSDRSTDRSSDRIPDGGPISPDSAPILDRSSDRYSDRSSESHPSPPSPSQPRPISSKSKTPDGVDLSALPSEKFPDNISEDDKPYHLRDPLTVIRCPEHQDRKIGDCHWCKTEHGNRQWYADPARWTQWEPLADFAGDIARVKAWAARK